MHMCGPYREGDVKAINNFDYESSPYYMSLNGTWKFNWVRGVANRPIDFLPTRLLCRQPGTT